MEDIDWWTSIEIDVYINKYTKVYWRLISIGGANKY